MTATLQSVALPWNEAAEQSVLGALLQDPDAFHRIADRKLQPAHFYDQRHRLILGAILELLAGGLPVDIVTVFNVLQERGQDDGAGGLVYINDLAGCVPSAANIGRYADVVLKAAMRRAIADAADKAVKIASTTVDPTDALDAIESVFGGLRSTKRDLAPRRFSELLLERTAHWTSLEDGTATAGIPTRLEKLNTVLGGGIKPGKNVVLAGRPGSGKSSLAWSIACDVAAQGSTVLVLSMEMQAGDLMDRAAASLGRVSLGRITTGRFENDDWTRLTEALEAASSMPLFIADQPALTLLDIRAKARQVKQQSGGLGLVVVDYLQLAASTGAFDKRHHQIEAISRGMKALAKELETTVLLLSQLTRESERDEPELAHLKESGAIEEDADTVLLLHALGDAPEGGKLILCKVAKNRQGPRGRFALAFDGPTQRWQNSNANVARKGSTS